jgi:uncharacterized membrane protein YbhN (UPF0104 family)
MTTTLGDGAAPDLPKKRVMGKGTSAQQGTGHRRQVLLSVSCFALAVAATIALWPLISPAIADAAEGLGRISPELLVLSGALFAAAPIFCGLAWRDAIVRAGGDLGRVDACARYGVGSFVNSVAPAHLGDVVRAVLLLEKLPAGGRRRILPWFGVIQGARLAALAALALAAVLPWFLLPLTAAIPGALVLLTLRRGTTRLVCLAFLSPLAKAAAIAVVLVGLDVGSPLHALAVVPALELAALVPLTPGNVGVAGAAASGALFAQGLPMDAAIQAGLVLHAVETAAGLTYGSASAVAWLTGLEPVRGLSKGLRSAAARAAAAARVQPEATKP